MTAAAAAVAGLRGGDDVDAAFGGGSGGSSEVCGGERGGLISGGSREGGDNGRCWPQQGSMQMGGGRRAAVRSTQQEGPEVAGCVALQACVRWCCDPSLPSPGGVTPSICSALVVVLPSSRGPRLPSFAASRKG